MKHAVVVLFGLIVALLTNLLAGESASSKALIDPGAPGVEKRVVPSSKQVMATASAQGIAVAIQPGKEGYPGIAIKPEGGAWDLSGFGHVEARVTNTGERPVTVTLRMDNDGDWRDNPWNAEATTVKPGASGVVTVIFGYGYGKKPSYALNAAKVTNVLVFANKSEGPQSFRIDSIVAGGAPGEKPPVDPNSIRTKPAGGVLLGEGVTIDAAKQITLRGAQAAVVGEGNRPALKLVFPASKTEQSVSLKPTVGRWDLTSALEVHVKLKNAGAAPVSARLVVESNGGPSEAIATGAMAPGEAKEVVVPFIASTIWNGVKGNGNRVTSDAVSAITVRADGAAGERVLMVEAIRGVMPPAQLPEWLGQRPPVLGEWAQTFRDEFDGDTIDQTKWSYYGENYWDKLSHFSKDNTIIGNGVVKLRFEKKRGRQNDDPKHQRETPYATGFLYTYDKWSQRYGYFEARMKLPTAPGLWPAFWMMPDRGRAPTGKEQWKRQSTGDGGMEFDIMEHLTRWGPARYNIAMHWDGYGKEHKSVGTDKVYAQPDQDGFVVAGMLWTPGVLVYYANGREVARWENERVASVPAIMMFTLPMGGWDNSPLDDSKLPDDFIIDWVRVWQRKDLEAK